MPLLFLSFRPLFPFCLIQQYLQYLFLSSYKPSESVIIIIKIHSIALSLAFFSTQLGVASSWAIPNSAALAAPELVNRDTAAKEPGANSFSPKRSETFLALTESIAPASLEEGQANNKVKRALTIKAPAKPTPAKPTSAKLSSANPTSAKPASAKPTSAEASSVIPSSPKPTSPSPSSVKQTPAKVTPVNPTSANQISAKETAVKQTFIKGTSAKQTSAASIKPYPGQVPPTPELAKLPLAQSVKPVLVVDNSQLKGVSFKAPKLDQPKTPRPKWPQPKSLKDALERSTAKEAADVIKVDKPTKKAPTTRELERNTKRSGDEYAINWQQWQQGVS
jgi:hypothetical protein